MKCSLVLTLKNEFKSTNMNESLGELFISLELIYWIIQSPYQLHKTGRACDCFTLQVETKPLDPGGKRKGEIVSYI